MQTLPTHSFTNSSIHPLILSRLRWSPPLAATPRAKMPSCSSSSLSFPPPPENCVVLGCGGVVVDLLAAVASYPKPDDKIRTTNFQPVGSRRWKCWKCYDMCSSSGLKSKGHIQVQETHERIHILADAERKREGLDELLSYATYLVCSAKFPQVWTEASSVPTALLAMLLRLPNVKFVIVTLGEDGCVMLERSLNEAPDAEEMDVEEALESLKHKMAYDSTTPSCVSSAVMNLRADGFGALCGRLHVGTAEKIPPSELVDTTGAGDAFIGAVVHALCTNMPPERMLPFAAQVAACKCRALGARSGLPRRSDPLLAPFLVEGSKIDTVVP